MKKQRIPRSTRYSPKNAKTIGVRMTADEIEAVRAISPDPIAKIVRELALASIGFKRSDSSEPA
jgi:hypothetical protein